MNTTKRRLWRTPFLLILALALAVLAAPQTKESDIWAPLRFFAGAWEGTGKGQPGVSRVQRDYQFVLGAKFIQIRNASTYDPQEKNPKGERHEDWSMLSFDARRKRFVLRQFHVEGFVNQYVTEPPSGDAKTIVFETESIENIPAGWRARETYKILSPDEFVEIFELAGPGKDFEVYVENRFKRKR